MATSHRSLCYSRLAAFGGSPIPPALEVVMKKSLTVILVVVGVPTVPVLVPPFLIPVNQFRPTIEEKASAALGRKVQLGDISLSLLSGSLSAENLSIGDDPKFSPSPFLTAKSLNVGVEMMPLIFSKTLNVTGITIGSPQVTLLRNAAGVWNYSSLGGSAAKSQAKEAHAEKTSGTANAAEVSVKKLTLSDGSIIVGSTSSERRSSYDHVNVTASDVSLTTKFPVTVTADLPAGGKFKLKGTYESAGEATVVNIKLDAKDMPAKDLEAFLPALGIHLPKGASLAAGTLNSDLNLTGPTNKLVITGNVGLFNGLLAGFDLGSKMSSVASLAGIKTGKALNIEKVTSNLRVAPTGIRADNFLAVLPTIGNLTGAGTVDSRNVLDFKMLATLTKEASTSASSTAGPGGGGLGGLLSAGTGGGGSTCSERLKIPFQIQRTTPQPRIISERGGVGEKIFQIPHRRPRRPPF